MRLTTIIASCMISIAVSAADTTKTSKPDEFYPEGKMIYCSCSFTNYGLPAGELRL